MKKCFIQKIKDQIFSNDFQDLIDAFASFIIRDNRFYKYADKWPLNLIKHYNNFSTNQNISLNILGKEIYISNRNGVNTNITEKLCSDSIDFLKNILDNKLHNKCIGIIQDNTGPQLVFAFYSIDDRNKYKIVYHWTFIHLKQFNYLTKIFNFNSK